ncbi:MAG: PBS lyase [Peptococcaceae bacterium]|nr:PBS lyase [Peptococcaceae bacterium]
MPFGANLTQRADCPFCGLPIAKPREPGIRRPGEMPLGACPCGAVYAHDATGRNLGAAFIEALVFACDLDWDLAWGLTPEDDYLERIVENYDAETNLLVPGGFFEGRRIAGALYFIRMHDDIQAVTRGGVEEELARVNAPVAGAPAAGGPAFTRRDVEKMVAQYRLEPLLTGAGRARKMIRDLQRLLYSGDRLLRLRAADVLGRLAAKVAPVDPGAFPGFLQQLLDSPEDPGSFCPGALDAAGEIIAWAPGIYAGFVPLLTQYLDNEAIRPQVLRALAKIAAVNPGILRKFAARLSPFLRDTVPENRAWAACALGNLRAAEAIDDLRNLEHDAHAIPYYEDGALETKTVGQMAAAALETMGRGAG